MQCYLRNEKATQKAAAYLFLKRSKVCRAEGSVRLSRAQQTPAGACGEMTEEHQPQGTAVRSPHQNLSARLAGTGIGGF